MFNSHDTLISSLLFIIPLAVACGSKPSPTDISAIEKSDSVPKTVKQLVKAVATDDTLAFANLVSYPLVRPYPLHDIESPEAMCRYYGTMVDDSLKHILTGSSPSDWEEYGWRGWSLSDGRYVWIDDNLYDVSYISHRENIMLDSITKLDMASIDPSLRKGWLPVACFKGKYNGAVYRIDVSRSKNGSPTYRLVSYDAGTNLRGKPSSVMTGYKETEGTAGTITYQFSSPDGRRALFQNDVPDGSPYELIFYGASASEDTVVVDRAYWQDLIK